MSRIVYSTDQGKMCPGCSKPVSDCSCKDPKMPPAGDGIVRIQRETKGRKGKGVTIVTGLPLAGPELKKLAKELKQKCSTGGAIKNHTLELQGDHRETLLKLLQNKGYTVKLSGG